MEVSWPVCRASLPRWDNFYPTFIWNLLSLLCPWKKIVWSSSFYNKQWRKAIMQNKCSYIIILKHKTKLIKENSIPPCRAGAVARVHMEKFHLI